MKRADFRKKIDAELKKMGFKAGTWIWQPNPARLIIFIDGEPKELPLKANMRKDRLAYELGRLQGWADFTVSRGSPQETIRFTRSRNAQIDLEEAIAAA